MNFLLWDRASRPEYGAWEELGNPAWNWNSTPTINQPQPADDI